jgi:hypothetical protein
MATHKLIVAFFSVFMLFVLESSTKYFETRWFKEFNEVIEMKVRNQAYRNLDLIEGAISKLLHEKDVISEKCVYDAIHIVGNSKVGGATGDIFAINMKDGTLFYDNSVDCSTGEKQKFNYDGLFHLADQSGGDSRTMHQAWNNGLRYRVDNLPKDRLSWNFDGSDEWLVCRILPTADEGFNGEPSAAGEALQIKICQGIQSDEVFEDIHNKLDELEEHKNFMLWIVRSVILAIILSILFSYLTHKEYSCPLAKKGNKHGNNCTN